MGMLRTVFALTLHGLLLVWLASVANTLFATVSDISVVTTGFASTILIKVFGGLANIRNTVLSGGIWVGELVTIPAFAILSELFSTGASGLDTCASIIDEPVIGTDLALVVLHIHLILL